MNPEIRAGRLPFITGRVPARVAHVTADAEVFDAVYRQCHDELSRYVRSIVRRPDVVEDVLQTVMLKALAALETEQRDFELRPWLFRIAHNEAVGRLRSERPTSELGDELACTSPPVGEIVERNQQLEHLWQDLASLTERQRQVVVLRELNGLGHEEIGRIVGAASTAVKQTLYEARRALADCAEGRDLPCDEVQRTLSDGDGRVRRGRRIQTHLESCSACRRFDAALVTRPDQLALLAPVLPLALSSSLLDQLAPSAADAATAAIQTGTSASVQVGAGAMQVSTTAAAQAGVATGMGLVGTGAPVAATAGGWFGGLLAAKGTAVAVAAVVGIGGAGAAVTVSHEKASRSPAPPTQRAAAAPTPSTGDAVATTGPAKSAPVAASDRSPGSSTTQDAGPQPGAGTAPTESGGAADADPSASTDGPATARTQDAGPQGDEPATDPTDAPPSRGSDRPTSQDAGERGTPRDGDSTRATPGDSPRDEASDQAQPRGRGGEGAAPVPSTPGGGAPTRTGSPAAPSGAERGQDPGGGGGSDSGRGEDPQRGGSDPGTQGSGAGADAGSAPETTRVTGEPGNAAGTEGADPPAGNTGGDAQGSPDRERRR